MKGTAIVTGAGGMIGGHLVGHLLSLGYQVCATDIKPLDKWWQVHLGSWNYDLIDLTEQSWAARDLFPNVSVVFHLASNMGGIGFITDKFQSAKIIHDNTMMDANVIRYARDAGVPKFFFSSSACVYPVHKMDKPMYDPLVEDDVYPANPNESYGWQKLHTEHILREYGDWAYVARFTNCYGPCCDWKGGREKVPAALCRKVAEAKRDGGGSIDIWGDGEQTRAFMYVDDCVRAVAELINTDQHLPVTLGPDYVYTINDLLSDIFTAANYYPEVKYDLSKPQGVRGRVFDHGRLRETIGWVPEMPLYDGVEKLYKWVEKQIEAEEQVNA